MIKIPEIVSKADAMSFDNKKIMPFVIK